MTRASGSPASRSRAITRSAILGRDNEHQANAHVERPQHVGLGYGAGALEPSEDGGHIPRSQADDGFRP